MITFCLLISSKKNSQLFGLAGPRQCLIRGGFVGKITKLSPSRKQFDEKKLLFPLRKRKNVHLCNVSMPRPPHLALMCVRQLTDRLSKRSGGMGNCLLLPQRFLFPTHWNPHCIGINGWIMRKQRLQLRCHVIVGRNNIKEIFNHTKAEIYLLLVYSG